jgi:hypothetical protein
MTEITACQALRRYDVNEGASPKAGDVTKEDTMAPIPKRLILVCVLMALLLSCAATVGRSSPTAPKVTDRSPRAPLCSEKLLLMHRGRLRPADNLEGVESVSRGAGARHVGASKCQ